mmetsp:Transcript_11259/g.42021  ORF Transcript_11259/g.42021 Transcript_11259/m.42021 type:complete len:618 (-) Transcript_11259:109-1962(-)
MPKLQNLFSLGSLATVAALAYVFITFSRLGGLLSPLTPAKTSVRGRLIVPSWPTGTQVRVFCYLSPKRQLFDAREADSPPRILLWSVPVTLGADTMPEKELVVRPQGAEEDAGADTDVLAVPKSWWSKVRKGQSLYVHILAMREGSGSAEEPITAANENDALYSVVPLVRKMEASKRPPKRRLLCDVPALWFLVEASELEYCRTEYLQLSEKHERRLLQLAEVGSMPLEAKWVPEVGIKLLSEFQAYDVEDLPEVEMVLPVARNLDPQDKARFVYQPLMHADEVGLTSDKYGSLNKTTSQLPLKLTVGHLSLARFRLMHLMSDTLSGQKDMGFGDQDIDDVRRLVADTSVPLLAVTIVASVLHLLFEFLAFRSDVNFWRNNKTLRGLSVRAVAVELLFQFIIMMFLYDEGASLLVLGPAAIGVGIQAWKVKRATGVTVDTSQGFPRLRYLRLEQELKGASEARSAGGPGANAMDDRKWSQLTQQVDRMAWGTLTLIVVPIVTGLALHGLLLERHVSWYSWGLGTLTAAVYGFGFALMTPQLIINHRLKSVAQLPWRFLCYRFVNTFIDDLFAFIIKMPTMHRMSCFRDDVVFILYLYQRWIYPVDSSRPVAGEDMGS